jgi:precorrin-4/cobalt-precorrin-4 C11-methyltransferase
VTATGRVAFVGAGPGAADLLTVRGARLIAEADVVLWPSASVPADCVREHAGPDAELLDSSRWGHDQHVAVFRKAAAARRTVAVVHAGELPQGTDLARLYEACRRLGMRAEVVPGVSPLAAASAMAGRELTGEAADDAVIMVRADCGEVRLPAWARLAEPGRGGTTTAVLAPAARAAVLVEQLRASGYPDATPVLVAYKVSRPDQLVLRTTLGDLECAVKNHRLWRQTVFLVGTAMQPPGQLTAQPNGNGRSYHPARMRGWARWGARTS